MTPAAKLGRCCFGAALLGEGARQIATMEFIRLVPGFPAWVPGHPFWVHLTGGIMVLAGGAIVLGREADVSAAVIGVMLTLLFLVRYVPQVAADPMTGFLWTNPSKTLALLGGAILLAGSASTGNFKGLSGVLGRIEKLQPLATLFLSVFFVLCGVQHFIYAAFVDTLVPAWLPPGPRFWTWFTGLALIAGESGLVFARTARIAALLSALMVFLWVLLLHIPRAIALRSTHELDGVFEALAITGVALLVAALRTGKTKPTRGG